MNIIALQFITTQPETITANAITEYKFQVSNLTSDFHKVSNENKVINVGIKKK